MKKNKKTLSLRTETVRRLDTTLINAHGGATYATKVFTMCRTACDMTVCVDCPPVPITPAATAVCTTN